MPAAVLLSLSAVLMPLQSFLEGARLLSERSMAGMILGSVNEGRGYAGSILDGEAPSDTQSGIHNVDRSHLSESCLIPSTR